MLNLLGLRGVIMWSDYLGGYNFVFIVLMGLNEAFGFPSMMGCFMPINSSPFY